MKLAKLLLLVPAFAMIACSQPVQPSSEEDKSLITKQEFNDIFQGLKLFRGDNFILETEIGLNGDKEKMIIESENSVTVYYGEGAEETQKRYVEFGKDRFFSIRYEEGGWSSTTYPEEEATQFFFEKLAFLPLSFEDFSRNEEKKSYFAERAFIELEKGTVAFQNVEIVFNESKPVSLTASFPYDDNPNLMASFTQAFTYGGAHVVNPK